MLYSLVITSGVCHRKKRPIETVLLSTHKICFDCQISNILGVVLDRKRL